jgi:hypothetical protein
MSRRTQTLRPATVGLGVVLSLFSMLQSSKLACALAGCRTCHAESDATGGICHAEKSCCHSKPKRAVGHSHTEPARRGCPQASSDSPNSVPLPFNSCPCPDGCVCKADPGPSIATESSSANASTQSPTVYSPSGDCALNAGSCSRRADFSTGYRCARDICVILCRFRA